MSTDPSQIAARLAALPQPAPWKVDQPSSGRPFEQVVVRGGYGHATYIADCGNDPVLAEFIANAPTDIAYLLAQRDAVLGLHEKEITYDRPLRGQCICCVEPWPCATVLAMGSGQ